MNHFVMNYMFQNHVTPQQDTPDSRLDPVLKNEWYADATSPLPPHLYSSQFIWLLQRFQQSLCCHGLAEHPTMETIIRRLTAV